MNRPMFEEFILGYFERSDTKLNRWLDDNPTAKIIKWSATPTGQYNSTRLIIEYIPNFYSSDPNPAYDDRDLEEVIEVLD